MRRFLPTAIIAILMIAVATPVNAGYLIIRVILEGASGSGGGIETGPGAGETGMGGPLGPGMMKPPRGKGGGSMAGPPGGFTRPPGLGAGSGPGDTSQPGGGMLGGAAAAGEHQHDPTRSLVVVVPVEENLNANTVFYQKRSGNHLTNPIWKPKLHMHYRGERFTTNLFTDNVTVQMYVELLQKPGPQTTRASEVRQMHVKWTRSKGDTRILFNTLSAALDAGMTDDALAYADELLKACDEKPDGLPPEVTGFAQAYRVMQKGIRSPANKPNSADRWRSRLRAQNVTTSMHYSVLFWDATEREVKRRSSMLEDNFRGFYLWHALRGVQLAVPDEPLVAILPKTGNDFFRLARALDVPVRLPTDGFYSVEHDLLLLSPERLDELGQTFSRQSQQIYQAGVVRDRLLAGEGPPLHIHGENDAKKPEEAARMQTLALVDRLLEDEATIAAISREGSRQLLYASARLPRYVELPEWLLDGSGSFFTRPKDPAFVTGEKGKTYVAVAMATGYGGPNYALQRYFTDLVEKKELNPNHGILLKNILTDAYFQGLRDPKDATDPDPIKHHPKAFSSGGGKGGDAQAGGYGRPPKPMGGGVGLGPPRGAGGSGLGPPRGKGGSGLGPPGGAGGSSLGPPRGGGLGTGIPGGLMGPPGMGQKTESEEEEDPATILRKKRDKLSIKAQATAWALYYYLAKDQPDKLNRFINELSALPRDLPLDGDTVLNVFCRSMGIENNKESLTRFANAWLDYIGSVPPASFDVALVEPKPSANASGGNGLGSFGMPPGGGGNPP